jgi:hypothetical protein
MYTSWEKALDLVYIKLKYITLLPSWGLLPYCEEEVCMTHWPGGLCWWQPKLLVEPPMPDRSRVGTRQSWACGQQPCPGKIYYYETSRPWRRQLSTKSCSVVWGGGAMATMTLMCMLCWIWGFQSKSTVFLDVTPCSDVEVQKGQLL